MEDPYFLYVVREMEEVKNKIEIASFQNNNRKSELAVQSTKQREK